MTAEHKEIERVWRAIVSLVIETRGDWRRNVVEATGLPFTRTRALRRLAKGEMTLRDLAESMGTDAPAATVTVNDLEDRGLVTRREHPDDRRAKLVSLTAAGRALVRAENHVPDPVPPALTGLSPRDVKVLAKIFDRASGKRARAATE
jgi:DNA-binding MarR family transcriptional regulator